MVRILRPILTLIKIRLTKDLYGHNNLVTNFPPLVKLGVSAHAARKRMCRSSASPGRTGRGPRDGLDADRKPANQSSSSPGAGSFQRPLPQVPTNCPAPHLLSR